MIEIFKEIETQPDVPAYDVLRNISVLFADESHEVLAVFKHVMSRLGWQGTYVHNAVELIDAVNIMFANHQTLDAVVADINYFTGPRLTGITAAREIRKAMPNVPIVFISAYVTSILKEEVRRVNAEIYRKPFDTEQLFVRLSQLIYWNRLATTSDYTGEDRRRNSVNRTLESRRATDKILTTPERIRQTLMELRDK